MIGEIKISRTKTFDNKVYTSEGLTYIELNTRKGDTFTTVIDVQDLDRLISLDKRWFVAYDKNTKQYYAAATKYQEDKKLSRKIYLHRFILGEPVNVIVDHVDHNGLNNIRKNLRSTKTCDNLKNRKGKNSNNKSGYRNVFWNTREKKWQVALCKNQKQIHIGMFSDVDEAGRQAELARQKYYGEFAGDN